MSEQENEIKQKYIELLENQLSLLDNSDTDIKIWDANTEGILKVLFPERNISVTDLHTTPLDGDYAYARTQLKQLLGGYLRELRVQSMKKKSYYNIYIKSSKGEHQFIRVIEQDQLDQLIEAINNDEHSIRFNGITYDILDNKALMIFSINEYVYPTRGETERELNKVAQLFNNGKWNLDLLKQMGFNITDKVLKQKSSGSQIQVASDDQKKNNGKIFISHSTKDKKIVNAFCDLILNNGLNINLQKEIFCTAIDGSKPKSGEKFSERIKSELTNAKAVIQFISKKYKESEVCLNEMGAAWVLNNKVIPIIIEPGKYDVGFIHVQTQQIQLSDSAQVLQFIQDHKGDFLPNEFDLVRLSGKVIELKRIYNKIYKKQANARSSAKKNASEEFSGMFMNQNSPPLQGEQKELNDHYFNNAIPIDLNKFDIELSFKTYSDYWRCGIRFSRDKIFKAGRHSEFPFYHFYKEPKIKTYGAFFYNEQKTGETLGSGLFSSEWTSLKVITRNKQTHLQTTSLMNSDKVITGYNYCQILAWADNDSFQMAYKIKLIRK